MAKSGATSIRRPVEQYDHKTKKRVNNPPVGLVDAKSDAVEGKKRYAYDPHLDSTLVWPGEAERTSFEIPTVSLHVHERIDPRSIIEAVRKKNGGDYEQMSLFSSKAENPPLREAIEFGKGGPGRAGADGLFRPALRHQIRLELPALRQQARREGRQG